MPIVRVVTDTIAQLPREVALEFGIEVVPAATVVCDGRTLADGVDLTLTLANESLKKDPRQWVTASIPPFYFVGAFEKLHRAAAGILCVLVSSRLTAVHSSAVTAAQLFGKERPGVQVEVFDSLNAAGGEALIVLAAARAAVQGKSMSEVIQAAEEARRGTRCLFVFDTLSHVYRTGRVPRLVGEAADWLAVRPVAKIGEDGKVHFVALGRSRARGVEQILSSMKERFAGRPVDAMVVHSAAESDARMLETRVRAGFDCRSVYLSEFSPIMGYATGPGVLGVAMCPAC